MTFLVCGEWFIGYHSPCTMHHSQSRHLERLAFLRPLHLAAAYALDADARALDRAADLNLNVLQIRPKRTPADARHLTADAAEVFGLAAPSVLIAQHRLLATNRTLHAHDTTAPAK